ncbi:MAG: sigma 54-interacting transcriptional regulator [Polyangiaceae bacterium]|nr:sigma 54-interacting transcriptional regulator [Polyangiaceae bacterium]MCL4752679.1 sigma 54-interacting transcriptional regulator [Myxococcales bacterium]
MASVRLEVLNGSAKGRVLEPDGDVVRIGRAATNELQLEETHVSGEHARLVIGAERVTLEDLRSTNGTAILRGTQRILLGEASSLRTVLESGDVVELGGAAEESTGVRVELGAEREPSHVVSVRPIGELPGFTASSERNTGVLATLYRVEKAIGGAADLDSVLVAVADAALELVPAATHATLVLRDDIETEAERGDAGYVPVLTRVRGAEGRGEAPGGAVAVTRSVFRKVVRERAAVLAADAPAESFSSESLLGASIRSTIGVPLWKGEEILGVVQVDNRASPGMFDSADLEALGVLAASASLAVANARLVRRLLAAEEQLQKENSFLKSRERAKTSGAVEIIGQSRAIRELMKQLDKVVDTRVTVLVEGETGTGKELIASAVHYRSRRRAKLFVAQNCAALPENLLESELFGHKRGSFTGATEEKRGLFDVADGGTLFLDEVTEMPLALQAKLLRVLQEGEIRPVGATHTKIVDVRIVAACNRNLEKEVQAGRFREDLYYRLKVFPIRVPPLRERRDDVPLLAGHFLERYTKEVGKPVAGFSQGSMELLMAYDWPGNVRELENEIQRLVIQAEPDGFITPDLLSPRVRQMEGVIAQAGAVKGSLKDMVERVEKYFILETLREHGNNKTSAAKTLGITREGLHKKLKQLGIG